MSRPELNRLCACGRPATRKIGSEYECMRCHELENKRGREERSFSMDKHAPVKQKRALT